MSTPGNSINETTTGITGFTGTAFTGSPATQYNVQVGGASTDLLESVAPSATSGVPLISQGSSANPAFGTAVVEGGGTGAVTLTDGGILLGSGTAAVTVTSQPTDGQLLIGSTGSDPVLATLASADASVTITNGAGTIDLAVASSGGAWVLISTVTAASDATVAFTGLSSTYFMYMVVIEDLIPATDAVDFYMRTSTNNGVSYDSSGSDYAWNVFGRLATSGGDSMDTGGDESDSQIILNEEFEPLGSAADESSCYIVEILNFGATNYTQILFRGNIIQNDGELFSLSGGGMRNSAADVDAIQFLMSSGNIETGVFKLYGLLAS